MKNRKNPILPNVSKKALWKPLLLLSIVIIILILSIIFDWGSTLGTVHQWIGQQGSLAPLTFLGLYLIVVLVAIPATPLGVAAGILFGSLMGIILVSIGSTLGATLAFIIARYFARDAVEQWIQKRAKLQKLYSLTETHGFLLVAITRLIPLFPFNLLNYALGLTKIPLRTYVFWSWLCMLPGTIIIVVGSDVISTALSTGNISLELIGVLCGAVVLLLVISWFAKKKIKTEDTKKGKITLHPPTLKYNIEHLVNQEISKCIECNKCLDICPAFTTKFSIKELNQATKKETPVDKRIENFTFSCMQCGYCVSVCPVHLHRDAMMLVLKQKIKHKKPWVYKRYLFIRGPHLSSLMSLVRNVFVFFKKMKHKDIAVYMENTPHKGSVLFYPGCYVYSPETMKKTLFLLDHIGKPYTVLGGLSYCCGLPHLLQGELEKADECLDHLFSTIKKINPDIIVTGCAECQQALDHIKDPHKASFKTLSVVEYILQHKELFPVEKQFGSVIMHQSCRNRSKKTNQTIQEAISLFAQSTGFSGVASQCCMHWNHNYKKSTNHQRELLLSKANKEQKPIVCSCLTCYETLLQHSNNESVIDILDLFTNSLQYKSVK